MRNLKINGIIIKRLNLFESDKIITVLSPSEGKVQFKAKNVRKITSHRISHMELLNLASFSVYKSNINSLPLAIEVNSVKTYSNIKSNLIKSNLSYHICEIVDSLLPMGSDNKNIFYLLEGVLDNLEKASDNFYSLIHDFEMKLLSDLGFSSPNLNLKGAKASLFIENIIEKKLKSREIIKKINFNTF